MPPETFADVIPSSDETFPLGSREYGAKFDVDGVTGVNTGLWVVNTKVQDPRLTEIVQALWHLRD